MFKSNRPEKVVAVVQRPPQDPIRETKGQRPLDTTMLGFYANRASRCLSASERAALEKVKAALQKLADKPPPDKGSSQ